MPQDLITRIIDWQRQTFGAGYHHNGLILHTAKELEEVLAAAPVEIAGEWIDVIFLAIHGYCGAQNQMLGGECTVAELEEYLFLDLQDKLLENQRRTGPTAESGEDVSHEHQREPLLAWGEDYSPEAQATVTRATGFPEESR